MNQQAISSARPFERLSRLSGYQVERHHVDPRGWTVTNAEGRHIGEVKDLIVDTERMVAAYLDVELDTKLFDLDNDPRVLVPMTRAQRDGEHRRLRVDGLTRERVASLCTAREAHRREFWNRWLEQTGAMTRHDVASESRTVQAHDELKQAIDRMQPGQTVRIPVVNEEYVVERRPLPATEAGAATAPPPAPPAGDRVTTRERKAAEPDPILPRETPPRAL